jgi:hypothetical protein
MYFHIPYQIKSGLFPNIVILDLYYNFITLSCQLATNVLLRDTTDDGKNPVLPWELNKDRNINIKL